MFVYAAVSLIDSLVHWFNDTGLNRPTAASVRQPTLAPTARSSSLRVPHDRVPHQFTKNAIATWVAQSGGSDPYAAVIWHGTLRIHVERGLMDVLVQRQETVSLLNDWPNDGSNTVIYCDVEFVEVFRTTQSIRQTTSKLRRGRDS